MKKSHLSQNAMSNVTFSNILQLFSDEHKIKKDV
jgi:hypothetical protein